MVANAIKVILILFIIGLGIFYINTTNYNPFIPSGISPMVVEAATVFFALLGYDAMSAAVEESTDGKKHMPTALIYSLVIAILPNVAATLMLIGTPSYRDVDPATGFAAFNGVGLPVTATIISVFAVLSMFNVLVTFLLGHTHIWFLHEQRRNTRCLTGALGSARHSCLAFSRLFHSRSQPFWLPDG